MGKPRIIKTGEDFYDALEHLTTKDRLVVFDGMKRKLVNIIKTGSDFAWTLVYLPREQRTLLYEAMKGKWPKLIKTPEDFRAVLFHLTPDQCAAVINSMKSKFSEIIKTGTDFHFLLKLLSAEQLNAVIDTLGSEMLNLEDLYDFRESIPHANLNNMISFIKNTNKSEPVKQFASVVMDNDRAAIKTSLTNLVESTRCMNTSYFKFWAKKDPLDKLVKHLLALEPKWKDRIKSALGVSDELSKATLLSLTGITKESNSTDEVDARSHDINP